MKLFRARFLWAGVQCESHLVVRFNIQLDLLAGECADPKQRMNVSAKLLWCSSSRADDDAIEGRKPRLHTTHLISIVAG